MESKLAGIFDSFNYPSLGASLVPGGLLNAKQATPEEMEKKRIEQEAADRQWRRRQILSTTIALVENFVVVHNLTVVQAEEKATELVNWAVNLTEKSKDL